MTLHPVRPNWPFALPDRPSAQTWRPAAVGIVRFACLPARVLKELKFPRTVTALDDLHRFRDQVGAGLSQLTDDLALRVGGEEDQTVRRALINVRRSLHRQRWPADRDVKILLDLKDELTERLAWAQEALQRLEDLEAALPDLLRQEYAARQRQLKTQLLGHPDFLASVVLVAPDLMESLKGYLPDQPVSSETHWRKLELTLATYWSRAATKTSPMARLTSTAVVNWERARPGDGWAAQVARGRRPSSVQLHRGVVRALFDGVTGHPALRSFWAWTLHPQLERDETHWRVRLQRRGPAGGGAVRVTVPVTATLQAVASQLAAGPRTISALERSLSRNAGASGAPLRAYLERLVDLGVLIPELQLADDLACPLEALRTALVALDCPLGGAIAGELLAISGSLDALGRAAHPERLALTREVRERLQRLLQDLGHPDALPPRLLYEDAGAELSSLQVPEVLSAAAEEWAGVAALAILCAPATLEQLDQVERFVRMFGVGGRCDRPLEFLTPGDGGVPLAEESAYLRELSGLRDRHWTAVQRLLQRVADGQRAGQGDVSLDLAWVAELAEMSGAPLPSRAMTLMLQPLPGGDVVVNGVLPGHGMLLGRQQELVPGAERRAWIRSAFEAASGLYAPARAAHLVPKTDSTINAFPSPLATTVRGPDDASKRPADLRIQDCALVHDALQHQLIVLDPHGQRLAPLYLGAYEPAFLTPVERAMAALAPTITSNLDLPALLRRQRGQEEPLVAWPRVRVGRVVLSRRTWMIAADSVLLRQPQEPEHGYWGRLREWARARQLPLQFFGLPDAQWRAEARSLEEMQAPATRLKPQFFDLDNFFLVRLFNRWAADAGQVWAWQEALPVPGSSGAELAGEVHVAELGLELHCPVS